MARLFVEQITVIDCAVLDAVRGLTGASWIVDLELDGRLDKQSMVLDFGTAKKQIKRALDAIADHCLLVPCRCDALELERHGDDTWLDFDSACGRVTLKSPAQTLVALDANTGDADALRAHLLPALRAVVPENVADIRLHLREEVIDGPSYRYTHGLRKHQGHCQRIAHGHRSRLRILADGHRDAALEQAQAACWADIHLGSREHLLDRSAGRLHFGYDAGEGRFELTLPEDRCEIFEGDTTVERIAAHIARAADKLRPGAVIEVRAYEGVMKGAIATA